MISRPSGTVTFLFTDIEGSTKLWEDHRDAMNVALARHDALVRDAIDKNRGYVFKTVGDAFCAAFPTAVDALNGAIDAQHALRMGDAASPSLGEDIPLRSALGTIAPPLQLRVRMALHTGSVGEREGDYFGPPLNRVARLLSSGYGEQILLSAATKELVRDRLPDGVTLRDLGEQRLKDLTHPEQVFQLTVPNFPSDFPPLKTLDTLPNNLPIQLTSFIGREKEIAEIQRLLETARLVTLTGAGGCGKTRLSLQIAADALEDFAAGAWFVELAPLTDPALVMQAIASTFRLQERSEHSLETTLKDYLREKNLLLILDNCEHLIQACAELSNTLLHACPDLKILATSREALGIAGETAYRVPSLAVPDPQHLPPIETLSQYDAVRLFIDRAISVQSTFIVNNHNAPAVAQICHRLGGIPLAIELAAARVKIFSAEEIEARLDDRFRLLTGGSRTSMPRQQTLRALIDWSFDLLSEPERVLLSRLAVFAGGWTFDAAEVVCADAIPPAPLSKGGLRGDDILDLLSRLIDKSLVLTEEHGGVTRYRMLETIRQYAHEKLQESSETDSVQDRHLDFFLALAEELEPELRRERQHEYLDRLEREHDNLRAALEWSLRMHRNAQMLRLGAALYLFWRQRDFWSEARKWYKVMLALGAKPEYEAMRPTILAGAALIEMWTSKLESAKQWARACLESSQVSGDRRRQAEALTVLGEAAWEQNEIAEAQTFLEQALALSREIDDQMGVADAFHWLGHVALGQNDYAQARVFFQDSYTRLKDFGDQVSLTLLLSDLGLVAYLQEDYALARAYSEQDMALCREIGSKFGMAKTFNQLGDLARCEGDDARADTFYKDSLTLFKELGSSQVTAALHNIAHVRLGQGDGAGAATLFHQALNEFRELGDQKGVADCLMGLAGVTIQMGHSEKGARLLGACEKIKQENGTTYWPANRIAYKRYLSLLHEQLDGATFNAGWAEGSKMTLEQAIEYALAEQVENTQTTAPAQPHDPNALTPREIEVLRLAQAGLSDAKIAEKLVISPRTVNTHLSSIYSKLGVKSRSAATRYALDHKLL